MKPVRFRPAVPFKATAFVAGVWTAGETGLSQRWNTPGRRSSKRAGVIYGRTGPLQFQEATVSHTKNWPTADRRFLYSLLMVLVFRR